MKLASKREIERIRDAASIVDIVSLVVELKNAGVGARKGLCPFHDEKTPSFTVRENTGTYHCFGCGEGGDVFAFVMKIHGMDFPEALEYVAEKSGQVIHWDEVAHGAKKSSANDEVRRTDIIRANNEAANYFAAQLETSEAKEARLMLSERNFTSDQVHHFGCGYAARGRDNLVRHLSNQGFTHPQLIAAGLVTKTSSGILDRFQGRVIWPIRDVAGDVLGFGARKLYDDDFFDAKYLNTSETRVYKKSKVLYGLDLARKPIAKKRQVVVVEGYTDVMAMHLAGIDTAVASCGTAFGSEHAQIVRRLMGDMDASSMISGIASPMFQAGKIIFTFDGDEAGLKAATKTFAEDQNFMAQTYVVIIPDGLDPCDLRKLKGDTALKALVEHPTPMFEFMIKTIVSGFDISAPEGRVGALRAAAPVVSGIRDVALRPEYTRLLSGWVGADIKTVTAEVQRAGNVRREQIQEQFNTTSSIPVLRPPNKTVVNQPNQPGRTSSQALVTPSNSQQMIPRRQNPAVTIEMNLIAVVLQYPNLVDSDTFFELEPDDFNHPLLRQVFERIMELGGPDVGSVLSGSAWIAQIGENMNDKEMQSISKLSTISLPVSSENQVGAYCNELVSRIRRNATELRLSELRVILGQLDKSTDEYAKTYQQIIALSKPSSRS